MCPIIEILEESTIADQKAEPTNEVSPKPQSADEIVDILKSSPSLSTLVHLLTSLTNTSTSASPIRLSWPSPESTRILAVLASRTIPDFWPCTSSVQDAKSSSNCTAETTQLRNKIITIFKSITGIKALLAGIEAQSARLKAGFAGSSAVAEKKGVCALSSQLIEVVESVLEGNSACLEIYNSITYKSTAECATSGADRELLLKQEFVRFISSNKILTVVGENEQLSKTFQSWLVGGQYYACWLAKNTLPFLQSKTTSGPGNASGVDHGNPNFVADISQLILRGLRLGYPEVFVHELLYTVFAESDPELAFRKLVNVLNQMTSLNQTRVLLSLVRSLAKHFSLTLSDQSEDLRSISSALATIFTKLVEGMDHGKQILTEFIIQPTSLGIANSLPVLRALLRTLSSYNDSIQTVLESSLAAFSDPLHISHSPALLQELVAQKILITAGYVKRSQPMALLALARSSYFSDGISNRLSASSERARTLGMVVGMALSKMIDKPENQLKFDDEELKSSRWRLYFDLVNVNDEVLGSIREAAPVILRLRASPDPHLVNQRRKNRTGVEELGTEEFVEKPSPTSSPSSSHRIVNLNSQKKVSAVKEGPKPYDPLTSSPSVLPNPPVYIRDLLSGLRNTDDLDKHALALSSAANLIRRQAAQPEIAAELLDVLEPLIETLAGLRSQGDDDAAAFEFQRQEALVALIVAQPERAAPYLIQILFDGDYSIAQRISIISSIGLASVELAGIKELLGSSSGSSEGKSKAPDHKTQSHNGESRQFAAATLALEASIVHPIAAEAVDRLSGPDSLKIETAASGSKTRYKSSAMARRHQGMSSSSGSDGTHKDGRRRRNLLARLVADHFFFPLTSRFWASYQAYGRSSPFVSAYVLPLLLKTMALLLDAAGPSSTTFPQMVSELWSLLLAMRTISLSPSLSTGSGSGKREDGAVSDSAVLTALLFSFLVLLDGVDQSSTDKAKIFDLIPGMDRLLVETLGWTKGLLEQAERAASETQIRRVGLSEIGPRVIGDDGLPIQTQIGGASAGTGERVRDARQESDNLGPAVPGGMEGERVQVLSASVWTKCRDLLSARKESLLGGRMNLFQ